MDFKLIDSKTKYKFFLVIGDFFFLYLSLFLSLVVRQGFYLGTQEYKRVFPHFSLFFLLWIFFLFILDFYSLKTRLKDFIFFRYSLIFCFLALFSGILYFYLQPQLYLTPRIILFLSIFLFILFFYGWRFFFEWLLSEKISKEKILLFWNFNSDPLRHSSRFVKAPARRVSEARIVDANARKLSQKTIFEEPEPVGRGRMSFLGTTSELKDIVSWLERPFSPYKIVGVYSSAESQTGLKRIVKEKKVEKIILSNSAEKFKEILSSFPELKFESFANFYEGNVGKVALSCLKDLDYLNDFYKEEKKIDAILKRFFDILFSLFGILFLLIFLFPAAILIKIDSPGPILFFQERIGKGRKVFRSYKFRSMFSSKNERADLWREKNRNEITKAGRFLRFTHLDEIPQLFNILKGDLSFVGPRPEWSKIGEKFEKEIPFYFLRYKVKPGFTGWAQINFPPSTSVKEAKEKFKYDLYYIKHRSFLLDIVIFLKSLRKIFG